MQKIKYELALGQDASNELRHVTKVYWGWVIVINTRQIHDGHSLNFLVQKQMSLKKNLYVIWIIRNKISFMYNFPYDMKDMAEVN